MKLFEIAQEAIDKQDKRMAEGLILFLTFTYNLSTEGVRAYLKANRVDLDLWDELVFTI